MFPIPVNARFLAGHVHLRPPSNTVRWKMLYHNWKNEAKIFGKGADLTIKPVIRIIYKTRITKWFDTSTKPLMENSSQHGGAVRRNDNDDDGVVNNHSVAG